MKESKYIILVFILFNGLLCYSQDCYIVSTEINLKNDFSEVWLNETFQGTMVFQINGYKLDYLQLQKMAALQRSI